VSGIWGMPANCMMGTLEEISMVESYQREYSVLTILRAQGLYRMGFKDIVFWC
jgi:hypothetical protein